MFLKEVCAQRVWQRDFRLRIKNSVIAIPGRLFSHSSFDIQFKSKHAVQAVYTQQTKSNLTKPFISVL